MSFKVVKQNTDKINLVYKQNFQKIVKIPDEFPPSLINFKITKYTWVMITPEQEKSTLIFTHETAFDGNSDTIYASLEMSPEGDLSLFRKVLPAVLADSQSLETLDNLEDPNLGSNQELGYRKIELVFALENSSQFSKIIWEFDKNTVNQNTEEMFEKLNQYPPSVIKILYSLQRSALIILAP